MIYRGQVGADGRIDLERAAELSPGTRVSVRPLNGKTKKSKRQSSTLYNRYKGVIGKAKALPADAAENHDHYLYGLPKRRR